MAARHGWTQAYPYLLRASVVSVNRRSCRGNFICQYSYRANAQSLGARLFPGAVFVYWELRRRWWPDPFRAAAEVSSTDGFPKLLGPEYRGE